MMGLDAMRAAEIVEAVRIAVEGLPGAAVAVGEDPPPWADHSPTELATLLVAVSQGLDPTIGQQRQRARALLRAWESGEHTPPTAELMEDIAAARGADLPAAIAAAPGPVAALAAANRRLGSVKGEAAALWLHHAGYPIVPPRRAIRIWLCRLGLMARVADSRSNEAEAVRLLDELMHHSHTPAPLLFTLLRTFTEGQGASMPAWCGRDPRCGECPLAARLCPHGAERRQASPTEATPAALPLRARLPESDLPREKLLRMGPGALTESELIAIILRSGTRGRDVLSVAQELVRESGGIGHLAQYSIEELKAKGGGIGEVKAITLKAAIELGRRLRDAGPDIAGQQFNTAKMVFELFHGRMQHLREEHFHAMNLNAKNRLLREVQISKGSVNQSIVHPREAFREAIRDSAVGVIFIHNHPSGDPTPSRDDHLVTKRLVETGNLLGIKVLDHIIIGGNKYYSFRDEGTL
jgi:DNA repair protein RadC